MGHNSRRCVHPHTLPSTSLTTIFPGGRINGASSSYNAEEMAYALKTAKSKFLFTLPSSLDVALTAASSVGMPHSHVFLLEGQREGFTSIQQLIAEGQNFTPDPCYSIPAGKTNKEVCGYLNFSSGTTGHPKAVMLSHGNIIAQCHQLRQVQVVEEGEELRALAVTPLFHISELKPLSYHGGIDILPSLSLQRRGMLLLRASLVIPHTVISRKTRCSRCIHYYHQKPG